MNRAILKLLILGFVLTACAGKQNMPTPKEAQKISQKFFAKYARLHSTSIFGQNKITELTINSVQPVSHKKVLADTVLLFENSANARALLTLTQSFPSGYKVSSWEFLQTSW